MKYLKRINEKISDDFISELEEFCEIHLVYLLDNDRFKLNIQESLPGGAYIFFNCISGNSNTGNDWLNKFFRWQEIKDHFIPFLTHLVNKYGNRVVKSINVKTRLDGWKTIKLEDLINDNTEERCKTIGNWWTIINIKLLK